MKKDILAILFIILAAVFVINGTEIQSVDEYYLTHIDDITEESETVFISVNCKTAIDNSEDLGKTAEGRRLFTRGRRNTAGNRVCFAQGRYGF